MLGFRISSLACFLVSAIVTGHVPEPLSTALRMRGNGTTGMAGRLATIFVPFGVVLLMRRGRRFRRVERRRRGIARAGPARLVPRVGNQRAQPEGDRPGRRANAMVGDEMMISHLALTRAEHACDNEITSGP